MTQPSDSDTRHLTPDAEGTGAQQAMVNGSQEVTTDTKQIQHDAVHQQKPLRVRGRGEPPHLSLALAGRLVGDFGAIVGVLVRTVKHRRHDRAMRCRVATQLVRDQLARLPALSIQQLMKEARGRPAIALRLNQDVDHIAVLVDRPPEIVLPALHRDEQFVQIPDVAHAPPPLPEPPGVGGAEGLTPVSDGLVRDPDARWARRSSASRKLRQKR